MVSIFQRLRGRPREKEGESASAERSWNDREITNKEDDRFDFRDYAEVLADRAQKAEPPLTIGLYGSWGSGKTSLMRLIEGELKGIETIWINVWQLSEQEEVWQAFLQALFNRVNRKFSLWQRIQWGKLVRELAINSYRILVVIIPVIFGGLINDPDAGWEGVITYLTNINSSAPIAILTSSALALWLLVKPAIEAARQVVNIDLKSTLKYGSYEEQITELMELQDDFAGMVTDLVGKKGRLVVFIDDLDRCTPDKIPDLLEAIKLFTTTPKCVYVLGLDHDIVRDGIQKKYQFDDKPEAEEYLEKIVQVPFHLPPLDEGKIEDFIRKEKDYQWINERCPTAAEVFSRGLEPNPRKVKRALNIYRTVLDLVDRRVYMHIRVLLMDPIDNELVAKIVVLQSRFRKLHGYLPQQPEFLPEIEAWVLEIDDTVVAELKDLARLTRKEQREYINGAEDQGRKLILETGVVLLGSKDESGLIQTDDLTALSNLLQASDKRFSEEVERDRIKFYLYLLATAEGGGRGVSLDLSSMVKDIRERGETSIYEERLKGILVDHSRSTPDEMVFVNMALDLLEGWEKRDFEPDTVRVPAGSFLMGSTPEQAAQAMAEGAGKEWVAWEQPQHSVELSSYRIGKYPVTNRQYQAFVKDKGYKPPEDWSEDEYPAEKADHPVVNVSWEEAQAYCEWLADMTGRNYRLPSEAEWEKAARGAEGRIYPWGDEFDPQKANTIESDVGGTTPVGQFSPQGDSPYGCAEMIGNVWEWCADLFDEKAYEKRAGKTIKDPGGADSGTTRLLRGGSFYNYPAVARCALRNRLDPYAPVDNLGFRVALSPSNSDL
jgi:formylglycine-generating enzyme required for sulfatase activity